MPTYEWRCRVCGSTRYTDHNRLEEDDSYCQDCFAPWKRVFGFHMASVVHEHFDHQTGSVISDRKQFRSELRRLSDEQTERTGFPTNYVEVDPSDVKTLGVTDEGLRETYDRKVSTGEVDKGAKPWL